MKLLLALCLLAPSFAQQIGSSVDFDRVTASNPNLAAWDRGTIVAATTISGKPHWKIRNTAGTLYTIPNDPRWIRPAGPAAPPDGTRTGPTPTPAPQPTRRFPPGTRVQFDRAEGSKPQFGRWDDGTVIATDSTGRLQIRGTNGIMYSIHDAPRWILPAGAPLPGPRHDYLDRPVPAPNAPVPANIPASGPLAGEWAVIVMDGKPTSGAGMTLNVVGSRYEFSFQRSTQSGTFLLSGNSIRMTAEDGTPFGTFQFSVQGNRLSLSSPQANFVLQRATPK